jgi:hypothetical protein
MSHSLPNIAPLDQPVWGAEAIAKVLNRPVKQVEVDPFARTTGTDFLIGNAAVPIS